MPMPMPNKGESKEDFVSRFMGNSSMAEEYPDEKKRLAVANSQWEEMSNNDKTYSIEEVEIFEAGKWNGDKYTESDLDDMVKSFNETRGALKPYLKLGHSQNQSLLQKDGLPAAGWITEIKRKGKKLIAKLENVPEKIYSLIQKKAYGRISSEIFWNLKLNGKTYRRALKAVALLGADTPEVHSLDDFINLYTTDNFDAELKCYHILKENTMDEKILEMQSTIAELQNKLDSLAKEKETLVSENSELNAYAKKIELEKKTAEIKNYLDGKASEGFITPAQVDYFTAVALGEEVKTYTNAQNQKIEGSSFDLVKNIIESGKKVVDFDQKTKDVTPEPKVYSKAKEDEDELDGKIRAYMKEHKVNYAEAYDAVSFDGGDN